MKIHEFLFSHLITLSYWDYFLGLGILYFFYGYYFRNTKVGPDVNYQGIEIQSKIPHYKRVINSFFQKYPLEKVFNLNLAFLSFSFVIYSIILSVNTDVIGQHTKYNYLEPSKVVSFADKQVILDNCPDTLELKPPPKPYYQNYHFLIFTDYTGSTSIEKIDLPPEVIKKINDTKLALDPSFSPDPTLIKRKDFKNYILGLMVGKLTPFTTIEGAKLAVPYLDQGFHTSFLVNEDNTDKFGPYSWHKLNGENHDEILQRVNSYAPIEAKEATNFKLIVESLNRQIAAGEIDSVNAKNNRKIAVTIISDFIHDEKTVSLDQIELEIKSLSELAPIKELNLLKIPGLATSSPDLSMAIIDLFKKYFKHSPFSNEGLLNIINSYDSDFESHIEAIINPTFLYNSAFSGKESVSQELIMYHDVESVDSSEALIRFPDINGNKNLVIKLKSNEFVKDRLNQLRIEYRHIGSRTSDLYQMGSLYAGIPEVIENFRKEDLLKLSIQNIDKYDLPKLSIEFYSTGNSYKCLVPIIFKQKLPLEMARSLSSISSLISILMIYFIGLGGIWIVSTVRQFFINKERKTVDCIKKEETFQT